MNSSVALPVKGASRYMTSPYSAKPIEDMPFKLLMVDTNYYKDMIDVKISLKEDIFQST